MESAKRKQQLTNFEKRNKKPRTIVKRSLQKKLLHASCSIPRDCTDDHINQAAPLLGQLNTQQEGASPFAGTVGLGALRYSILIKSSSSCSDCLEL